MKRVILISLLLLSACQQGQFGATETGALGGAAAGAGLGAIIGNQTGHTGAGLAIGSAAGALGGALIGGQIDRQDRELNRRDKQIGEQDDVIRENRRLLEELKERGIDVRDSERGIVVNLPDVLFEFGRSALTSSAVSTISEIANVVQRAPSRSISIEGHTDSIGTIEYNFHLSDARARRVADELVHDGLLPRRITIKALGETDPIASNKTEQGRRQNRRVEVVILNPR